MTGAPRAALAVTTRGAARVAALVSALVWTLLIGTAGDAQGAGPTPARRGQLDADAPLPLVLSTAGGVPVDEAQLHFRRGVELYADGDSAGALVELRRAYALVPSYRVLFNLGQVAYQCGDHAAAFGYLTRYLTEGGNQIPEPRRKEVARDLSELRAWVGFLSIETKEPALRVTIDDAEVGVTPLASPVAANAGRRRIDVATRSGEHQTRTVELGAGEILAVPFGAMNPTAAVPPARHRRAPEPSLVPAAAAPEVREAQAATPVIEPPRAPPPRAVPPVLTPPPPAPELLTARAVASQGERPRPRPPWITWTLAVVAAGGAAATGALAWSTSQSLHDKAAAYPVRASDLQDLHDRERRYALASDGLLAGAVVLSAIALYLTLTRPAPSDTASAAVAPGARW